MAERDAEHEILRQEIKAILLQNESNFEILNNTLDNILEQTKKTNGRVTALEDFTEIFRIVSKHKWLFAIIAIGIYNLFELIDIKQWLKMIF